MSQHTSSTPKSTLHVVTILKQHSKQHTTKWHNTRAAEQTAHYNGTTHIGTAKSTLQNVIKHKGDSKQHNTEYHNTQEAQQTAHGSGVQADIHTSPIFAKFRSELDALIQPENALSVPSVDPSSLRLSARAQCLARTPYIYSQRQYRL
eukprot:1149577-Pelagomonas_calceolata.AAC.10